VNAPLQPTLAELSPPRRLDPRTIVIKALPGLPSAIFALPIIVTAARGGGPALAFAFVVIALLLGVAVVFSWLGWRMFTYQVLPDQLVISRGVLHRTRRSIPVERIQDVSLKQGPVARLLGLAEVRIETGGGEKDEGRLDSVSLTEAHRLRALLRGLSGDMGAGIGRDVADTAAQDTVSPPATERILFRLSVGRLLYFGLFNFSLVWIAAIFGAMQYFGQALDLGWDRLLDVWDVAERELASRLSLVLILAVAGGTLGLGLAAGVVRTVLQSYDFKLTFAEGRFRYSRGLLTRTEVVVAQRQIQLGLIERGLLSGRLGWCAFKVQTLGGSDHVSGQQELAPFARRSEVEPLIALAGLPAFDPSRLQPVSAWHTLGALIGFVGVPAIILIGAASLYPLFGLLLLALPVPLAVAIQRRRHHRYALAETSLQVARGVLKQRDWTVPYGNIQSVTLRRGLLQRRMGVATVRIDTAGGSGLHRPHIHDIAYGEATNLIRELIARIDNSTAPAEADPEAQRA
jgi:putative membrane protein